MGLYIVAVAWRKGVPLVVVARMLLNLGVDALVGAVPLVGDVADIVHRANQKNVALLERRHQARKATIGDWAIVGGAALVFLAALALPVVALILALRALW